MKNQKQQGELLVSWFNRGNAKHQKEATFLNPRICFGGCVIKSSSITNSRIYSESQGISNSQDRLEKQRKQWRICTPYFKTYFKAAVVKQCDAGMRTHTDQLNRMENPEVCLYIKRRSIKTLSQLIPASQSSHEVLTMQHSPQRAHSLNKYKLHSWPRWPRLHCLSRHSVSLILSKSNANHPASSSGPQGTETPPPAVLKPKTCCKKKRGKSLGFRFGFQRCLFFPKPSWPLLASGTWYSLQISSSLLWWGTWENKVTSAATALSVRLMVIKHRFSFINYKPFVHNWGLDRGDSPHQGGHLTMSGGIFSYHGIREGYAMST